MHYLRIIGSIITVLVFIITFKIALIVSSTENKIQKIRNINKRKLQEIKLDGWLTGTEVLRIGTYPAEESEYTDEIRYR